MQKCVSHSRSSRFGAAFCSHTSKNRSYHCRTPTRIRSASKAPSSSRCGTISNSSSTAALKSHSNSSHLLGWSETAARSLAALAAAACLSLGPVQQPAWSKPALLDLPACSNFKGDGVIKYCDLSSGSGESPFAGDLILVDYTARAVATGEVYDGSRNFKFTVGNAEVIPGWEQGILGNEYIPAIKEGGARTLLVPPELAYGSLGDGCLFGLSDSCRIPPNSPVEITFKYRGLGY